MLKSNPILNWEMTAVGRRKRYFWIRVLFAVVMLFLLWSVYQGMQFQMAYAGVRAYQMFGEQFFWSFSFAQLTAVLLLAPAYVATSVAVEKQRRTIEYLFATDLRNGEIILGKWAARSLNIIVLILSGMPIVACAMLFGSIGWGQVLAITTLNAVCMFSVASLAILVSIYSKDARVAITQSYTALVLLLLAPVLLQVLFEIYRWAVTGGPQGFPHGQLEENFIVHAYRFLFEWFQAAHPYMFMYRTLTEQSYGNLLSSTTWTMIGSHAGLAAICLTTAIVRVRKAHLEIKVKAPRKSGSSERAATHAVGQRPMVWKEWRFNSERSGRRVAMTIAINVLVWGGFYGSLFTIIYIANINNSLGSASDDVNIFIRFGGTLLLALGLLRTAIRAAGSITAERDRDTWISLLATPLTEEEIIHGKLAGSLKPLAIILLAMAPAYVTAVVLGGISLLAIPLLLVEIAAYGGFVAALGVHQSLFRKTTSGALGTTLAVCVVLGGVGQAFSGCVFGLLSITGVDLELFAKMTAMSLPWLVLGGSAFMTEELDGFNEPDVIGIGMAFIVAYALAGMLLTSHATLRFASATSRTATEDVPEPQPADDN